MYFNSYNIKITTRIFFVIVFIFFSTLHAKNPEKYNKAENIAGYLSGIVLLNESKYGDSLKFLKKLDGLEETHNTFAIKYLYQQLLDDVVSYALNNFYLLLSYVPYVSYDHLV